MIYPFVELNDGTNIVYSEAKMVDGKEKVKVYMEKPDAEVGFRHATCWLPDYKWEDIYGFTDEEMNYLNGFVESTAHIIIRLARCGDFENAANY
ncbi:MAG: hypothetical protein IJP61_07295 [Treponema sp.]|nr:hypothetical protein [Treponema sp.]